MISVIIASYNRPQLLMSCVESLLRNLYANFEIIIVDQSDHPQTDLYKHLSGSKKITYIPVKEKGKARALNTGMQAARGDIFAFTDDDCIVSRTWLRKIHDSYRTHPPVAGVFGNTYPYKPNSHPNEICPATFVSKKTAVYRNPSQLHYLTLGQGNNMSFRKSTIEKTGNFQEWLGPGKSVIGGEETDIIFRILTADMPLMVNPKMIVYHNKWLTRTQESILQCAYTYGLMAAFGYHLITRNNTYAWTLIKLRTTGRLMPDLRLIWGSGRKFCKDILLFFLEALSILAGVCVGAAMSLLKLLK
jgi:GT2 family glycosyltransferase